MNRVDAIHHSGSAPLIPHKPHKQHQHRQQQHHHQQQQAQALFDAPSVVVSHQTQADPVLCYGNKRALALWEMDLPTLTSTPSRLTAEPVERAERQRLLDAGRGDVVNVACRFVQ